MPVYRLLIEYDGGSFHGWQMQPVLRTIQGEIDRALTLVTRQEVRTSGAGRTDQGVHASGQVASFRSESPVDCRRAMRGVEGICGRELRILRMEEAPEEFHARHSAIHRDHAWRPREVPPLSLLRAASDAIIGRHDFTSFANASPDEVDPRCEILRADWDCWEDGIQLTIRADHFLYKMVRTIVGTLLRESLAGGEVADRMRAVLGGCSRRLAAPPAPARGLNLERVGYDPLWPLG